MEKRVVKEILSWVVVVVVALVLAYFINHVVLLTVKVPTGSMENTIQVGDKVMTYRQAYLFDDPARGDVIVFPFPDDESKDYIKRIIGLPGETVEGKDGLVYINGKPMEEPYVKEKIENDFGPYKVPKDSYFMMGDNRNGSEDSRFWINKFVSKNKIKGKAFLSYLPLKWFKKYNYPELKEKQ